ncbi:MAG: SDR family NAD(P)-dependent oxidoreductase, partial [Gemmatimonadales bacterium]
AGRSAVVTGGSRGIGRATALLLARAGADVGVTYHTRRREAEAVVAEIRALGRRSFATGGDLAEPATAGRLAADVTRELGGLDCFVANAGIWPSDEVPLARLPDDRWRGTMAANLDAVFHSTRAALGVMRSGGRVVIVSSTAGQRGEAGHADYAATKGAVIALTKSLAIECAPDILVNCVAPGWVDTEMCAPAFADGGRDRIAASIPLRRVPPAEDIAGPILFLCSDLARHLTGEVLNVNGGSVLCG